MSKNLNLNELEKKLLFWASFLALEAAVVGLVFRSMVPTVILGEVDSDKDKLRSFGGHKAATTL